MKAMTVENKEVTKAQIIEALNTKGVNLNNTKQFVLWFHRKYGLTVDSLSDYRLFNGCRTKIDDLTFIVPAFDL